MVFDFTAAKGNAMKTTIKISEHPTYWSGELFRDSDELIFGCLLAKRGQSLPAKAGKFARVLLFSQELLLDDKEYKAARAIRPNTEELTGDRHGCKASQGQAALEDFPLVHKQMKMGKTAKNINEFRGEFIALVQMFACDTASNDGVVLTVANFVEEFWTPEHIRMMANRLKKKPSQKQISRYKLKEYLRLFWEKRNLCELDRYELANHVNSKLTTNFKPSTVWQTAYRGVGLFSDRQSGPKPGS
jgi:hypothetical protein